MQTTFKLHPNINGTRHEKKAQAPQACLGNILDGWGTFWTKIYVVLSHFTVCRKWRIFRKVFKVKMGTLSPTKGDMTHWWSKYLRYNHYTKYIIKIEWNCITIHLCIFVAIFENVNFTRPGEHFRTLNLCRGNAKALFSCLIIVRHTSRYGPHTDQDGRVASKEWCGGAIVQVS